MFLSLCKQYLDSLFVVVFDVKGLIFCDELFVEYKVNWLLMFDDLWVQVELLYVSVCVFGLLLLCVEGVEVDDVIGILVCSSVVVDCLVVIFIGDKDMV